MAKEKFDHSCQGLPALRRLSTRWLVGLTMAIVAQPVANSLIGIYGRGTIYDPPFFLIWLVGIIVGSAGIFILPVGRSDWLKLGKAFVISVYVVGSVLLTMLRAFGP